MRLIDADRLEREWNQHKTMIDNVDAQPTVDTIKHGHWIFHKDIGSKYIECSNCGAESGYDDEINQLWGDYCKYCGAKMDEVTE